MHMTDGARTRPHRLILVLAAIAAVIIGIHVASLIAMYGFGRDNLYGITFLFDVDEENNVPAVFSLCMLLIAAILLAMIARRQKPGQLPSAGRWAGLSVVFFYLAADEFFSLHERLARVTAQLMGGGVVAHYAWLVPYAIAGLAFLALYARFLRQLDRDTRKRFLIAAAIYVGGAFGTEIFAALYVYVNGPGETLGYDMLSGLEETLEMTGIIFFIHALVVYLEKNSAPMPEHRGAVVTT